MVGTDIASMRSQNFEFLRSKRAVLADLAGFAERYAHEDAASSLIKQRSFVEHAFTAIYGAYHLRDWAAPGSNRGPASSHTSSTDDDDSDENSGGSAP